MSYLVDTNVLLRSAQPHHPVHQDAVAATVKLKQSGESLCITPQNLIEFWAVATRPVSANGLELSVTDAAKELERLKRFFILRRDTPAIYTRWESLVIQYQVTGKPSHDARLVAAMMVHKLTHILTFNIADFKRFSGITAVDPISVK
jgi:predicted nucleic acid-binding protein